jgi:hypothetical protein
MAVTAGFTNQAKSDYLTLLAGHTLKLALYLQANSSLGPTTTTVYTATGEVVASGYTAGGQTLTGATVIPTGSTYGLAFTNPSWASSTITADACIIYDTSNSNHVLGIFTFPTQTSSGSTFTLSLAAAGIILAM